MKRMADRIFSSGSEWGIASYLSSQIVEKNQDLGVTIGSVLVLIWTIIAECREAAMDSGGRSDNGGYDCKEIRILRSAGTSMCQRH
ncbi:hypothetical protein, partial [Pantoea sp. A4]|uniref:hypothetical protein n=1 Tax=Pantoea sp. A4 TaxID=1225184 RepID=UPI0005674D53